MEFYKSLHDPRKSYKMVQDPSKNPVESSSILKQCYGILDKIRKRSIAFRKY